VILLLDGVPLNSTYDGQFDPSFIPLENVARIKVMTTTASVLYGEGGLAGVINVVTRGSERRLTGSATGEIGEGESRLLAVDLAGGGETVRLLGSVSARHTATYPSVAGSPSLGADGELARANADHDRLSLFALASLQPTASVRFGAVAGLTNGAYGVPPGLIDNGSDPFAQRPRYERVEDRDGSFGQLSGAWERARLAVRAWGYLNRLSLLEARYDDATYSSMDDPTVQGTYRQRSTSRLAGGALQARYDLGRWGRLSIGLSADHDAWRAVGRIRDVATDGGGAGGGGTGRGGGGGASAWDVRTFTADRSLTRYGAAFEYEIHPVPALGVVAGVMRHGLAREVGDPVPANGAMAAAYWDPYPRTRVRVSAAHKFRFPTIRQLYAEDGGNPDLDPETADLVEAGITQAVGGGTVLGASIFRMDVRNYIERLDATRRFENNDHYRFTGLELSAETRPFRPLEVRGGYAFLDTEDRSPGAAREALQYRPRHRLSATGIWSFSFGLQAAVTLLRVADQVYYSRREPVESRELPDYTLTGLRLRQRLPVAGVSLYLGAHNLFDVAYEEQYGSPMATRVLYAGARVRW
jgi:outer membrane receptor protein involved in Fe transport